MAGGWMLPVMLNARLLLYFNLTSVLVMSWTYTYSSEKMKWADAKAWCENQSQKLMIILNEEENDFLKDNLPKEGTYYWIGLRKTGGNWSWQGTGKMLEGNGSWAHNEPNNLKQDEDCVEIYINNQGTNGKWNDEKCSNLKRALCYNASCFERSCSEHGVCVDIINNYTCNCNLGFTGPRCEEVVQCPPIATVPDGRMNCSHLLHTNSYNSMCVFSCDEGFELRGSHTTLCDHTGHWTHNTPTCTGYNSMLMALSGSAVVSTVCCSVFCVSCCRKKKKSVKPNSDQEEVMNAVYDAGDAPLEPPLNSA